MTDDNLCAWLRTHRINTGVSAECERALKAADRIETLAAQDQHNQRRLLNAEVLNASLVERLATAEAANMVLFQQLASDAPDPDQQRSVRFNNVLSATIADLSQRLATAEAERDEARRFGAEAGQRYYNALLIASCDVTCAFCGATYPRGTPRHGDGALADHIKVCPKHPMRDAEAERDALRDNIATLANGVVEITADKLVLNREIDALRAQLSTMTQAVGLATTASPTMEMNAADPIGMMQTVCAEVNALREQLKQVESVLAALQQGQGEREEAAFRLGWANRGNQWNPNAPLSVEVAIAAWRASQKGTP